MVFFTGGRGRLTQLLAIAGGPSGARPCSLMDRKSENKRIE